MKKILERISKAMNPTAWFILSLISGSMTILTLCLAIELGGVQFKAAFNFVVGGFKDMEALFVAIYGSLFTSTFYFGVNSYRFYKKSLITSKK